MVSNFGAGVAKCSRCVPHCGRKNQMEYNCNYNLAAAASEKPKKTHTSMCDGIVRGESIEHIIKVSAQKHRHRNGESNYQSKVPPLGPHTSFADTHTHHHTYAVNQLHFSFLLGSLLTVYTISIYIYAASLVVRIAAHQYLVS